MLKSDININSLCSFHTQIAIHIGNTILIKKFMKTFQRKTPFICFCISQIYFQKKKSLFKNPLLTLPKNITISMRHFPTYHNTSQPIIIHIKRTHAIPNIRLYPIKIIHFSLSQTQVQISL